MFYFILFIGHWIQGMCRYECAIVEGLKRNLYSYIVWIMCTTILRSIVFFRAGSAKNSTQVYRRKYKVLLIEYKISKPIKYLFLYVMKLFIFLLNYHKAQSPRNSIKDQNNYFMSILWKNTLEARINRRGRKKVECNLCNFIYVQLCPSQ